MISMDHFYRCKNFKLHGKNYITKRKSSKAIFVKTLKKKIFPDSLCAASFGHDRPLPFHFYCQFCC